MAAIIFADITVIAVVTLAPQGRVVMETPWTVIALTYLGRIKAVLSTSISVPHANTILLLLLCLHSCGANSDIVRPVSKLEKTLRFDRVAPLMWMLANRERERERRWEGKGKCRKTDETRRCFPVGPRNSWMHFPVLRNRVLRVESSSNGSSHHPRLITIFCDQLLGG